MTPVDEEKVLVTVGQMASGSVFRARLNELFADAGPNLPVTFADTNPSRVNAVVARFGTGFAESLVAARSNVQPSSVTVLANLSGSAVGVADAVPANARLPAINAADTAAQAPTAFPVRRFPVCTRVVSGVVVAMGGLPGG